MSETVKEAVKQGYGAVARSGVASQADAADAVARAFGYSTEELASLPDDANLGLSCGNPTALASIQPGETVVDLGSGGGLDVFLAAQAAGPNGKAIGIDMTPDMIALATRNAKNARHSNTTFLLGEIDNIPLDPAVADCVISNCVINLVPDKPKAFAEIFRVLKPGGRVAISDIAIKKDLPPALASDIGAYIGCIAGAIPITDYRQGLLAAGFEAVDIIDSGADLNAYGAMDGQSACCGPAMGEEDAASCCGPTETASNTDPDVFDRLTDLLKQYDINAYAASVKVMAVKPARS